MSQAAAAACASVLITAAEAPAVPLALRDAVERALLGNKQLQIERINPDIARQALRASYGIYDPLLQSQVRSESANDAGGFDPANFSADAIFSADSEVATLGLAGYLPSGLFYTIGGNYAHSSGTRNFLNFDSYKLSTGITLEQPLLRNFWIDQPRWNIQVNKRNLRISELGVQFVAMTVINLTQQGYSDLCFAWENLRIQEELRVNRAEFLRGIRRQIELGAMTVLEEKMAQSQAASIETGVSTAESTVALASNNLKTLLGLGATNWSSSSFRPVDGLLLVPAALDLQNSWSTGMDNRPDLLQLAINLETAELTVKYRKNQLFPTLNLIGSYGLRGSDAIQAFPPDQPKADFDLATRQLEEQTQPNSMVGVLFSIPLTSTAERANYRMSKELKKQAQLLLKQKEELVMREIADAIDTARYSFQRAMAAREAVNFAGQALEAEEAKLQGGTGSTFLVLQAQSDLATAKIAEAGARRDYNKAVSQLYFTEGTLLDKFMISFDYKE
jgi:outer membrane protein TolC